MPMYARELIELAAWTSHRGFAMARGESTIDDQALNAYWIASKSRLDRWGHVLKLFGPKPETLQESSGHQTTVIRVIEEIFASEILTRIWTAMATAHDRCQHRIQAEPIAHSVLLGHLEARHRGMNVLIRSSGIDVHEAVRLNRFRRRCERWTDMLLGRLASVAEVERFAANPDRVRDFAEEFRRRHPDPLDTPAWLLTLASLRAAFSSDNALPCPNAELNHRIARSILCCFSEESTDLVAPLFHGWQSRLSDTASDAQALIDELLAQRE